MKIQVVLLLALALAAHAGEKPFPARVPMEKPDMPLSPAMKRLYDVWNRSTVQDLGAADAQLAGRNSRAAVVQDRFFCGTRENGAAGWRLAGQIELASH